MIICNKAISRGNYSSEQLLNMKTEICDLTQLK